MKMEELKNEVTSSETEEVIKILETLDQRSAVLAKVYLTALGDRQAMESREEVWE